MQMQGIVDISTLETLLGSIAGLIPSSYDYLELTYVASGNGVGEIETITYKTGGSAGTTVATITITYNSDHEIATVTAS